MSLVQVQPAALKYSKYHSRAINHATRPRTNNRERGMEDDRHTDVGETGSVPATPQEQRPADASTDEDEYPERFDGLS